MNKFVPDDVDIPAGLETNAFRLRKLTINDLVKDYDAVMSSVDHLFGVFGPDDNWPLGLSLEENLVDLGWHQKEYEIKSSFAYTVMSPDESTCLGCVYVDPSEKRDYEARVVLWVRQSMLAAGLDEVLFSTIKVWLSENWWFNVVAYPGRDMSWPQWNALPNRLE